MGQVEQVGPLGVVELEGAGDGVAPTSSASISVTDRLSPSGAPSRAAGVGR
jgi:hypothetical protein